MSPTTSKSDQQRVDLVIQYSLLVAGEADEFFERQLGPIHLIKYVYLADLAHAKRHGTSFTGTNWRFHKFGPWAQTVNERIAPALAAIGAEVKTFPSDYEDKQYWTRYFLRDEHLLREKASALPGAITLSLPMNIRRYGKDTPTLLDYVYRTAPMLVAAPGETLDLSIETQPSMIRDGDPPKPKAETLSVKRHRKLGERIASLSTRERGKSPRLINPVNTARYDEVYMAGLTWLDELAGPTVQPGEYTAEFSEDIWKSPTRKGPDAP